jgi:phage shock protein PspC (stress-responsive transcriptional regulator)
MVAGRARPDPGPMPETPLPPDSSPEPEPGPAPDAHDESPPPRRLLRSRDDRVLGGVCGGIARYFGIDPVIVRVAAVGLLFIGGASIPAYLAALALVPEDDGTGRPRCDRPSRTRRILGAIALVIAGFSLLDNWWWGPHFMAFGWLAPMLLLVVVFAVAGDRLLRNRGDDQPTASRIVGAALVLGAVMVGAVVLAIASAWVTAAGGGTAVAATVVALGVAMVALAFRTSRARWLALPALVLAIPAGVVSAAGIDSGGGVGQRSYQPASLADLRTDPYKLGTGELRIDLRDAAWPQGATARLKLDVGVGHALVLVPRDVCVQSNAHAGLGYIGVLGQQTGGADVDDDRGTVLRYPGRKLVIDSDMGIGAIEVRHEGDGGGPGRHRWGTGEFINDRLANAGCAGSRA